MSFKPTLLAGLIAVAVALPCTAYAHMMVSDGYARSTNPASGAAFLTIMNHSDVDDRVISVSSDAAARVELHTHIIEENGLARMVEVEEGFGIPAGESFSLRRGGEHVMFMGLTTPWADGDEVTLTIHFEHAAPVTVTLPVDLQRMPAMGGHAGHGDHAGHGQSN